MLPPPPEDEEPPAATWTMKRALSLTLRDSEAVEILVDEPPRRLIFIIRLFLFNLIILFIYLNLFEMSKRMFRVAGRCPSRSARKCEPHVAFTLNA